MASPSSYFGLRASNLITYSCKRLVALLILTDFANQRRYFVVGELATTNEEVVRIAGLLRGTESAVQAVSVSLHPDVS